MSDDKAVVEEKVADKPAAEKAEAEAPAAQPAPEAAAEVKAEAEPSASKEKEAEVKPEEKAEKPSEGEAAGAAAAAEPSAEAASEAKSAAKADAKKKDAAGGGKKKEVKQAEKALRNIIVNHLPAHFKEADIKKIFAEYGEVESTKLVLNRATGASMKYAFVIFKDAASVPRAIKAVNNQRDGSQLRVAYAAAPGQPKGTEGKHETVYVSGFESVLNREALRTAFEPYGNVHDVKVMDLREKKFAKGVAFIKFGSVSEAESAIVNVDGKSVKEGTPKLTVRYSDKPAKQNAVSQMDPLQATLAMHHHAAVACVNDVTFYMDLLEQQGRNEEIYSLVFVSGLPPDTTEALLWTIYGQFGAIETLLMPVYPNGMCKGVAIVHYVNEMSAYNAADVTQGQSLNGFQLQITCRARMQHHTWHLGDLEARIHDYGVGFN
eukprot:TRINITY_DN2351_c1_g1_i1.p2 TRINITY_DN2351_c1_g1~~TRINITY_DN2351_c1_g1_i1.p2  ORF type:complete len:434 (+),score=195.86 TRINITY_DN2351_c1_g1_i1:168-1469(+)